MLEKFECIFNGVGGWVGVGGGGGGGILRGASMGG